MMKLWTHTVLVTELICRQTLSINWIVFFDNLTSSNSFPNIKEKLLFIILIKLSTVLTNVLLSFLWTYKLFLNNKVIVNPLNYMYGVYTVHMWKLLNYECSNVINNNEKKNLKIIIPIWKNELHLENGYRYFFFVFFHLWHFKFNCSTCLNVSSKRKSFFLIIKFMFIFTHG